MQFASFSAITEIYEQSEHHPRKGKFQCARINGNDHTCTDHRTQYRDKWNQGCFKRPFHFRIFLPHDPYTKAYQHESEKGSERGKVAGHMNRE